MAEGIENTDKVVNADTSTEQNLGSNSDSNDGNEETITIADLQAQIQNLTSTNARLKRANDKLASENGDLNKKYREKLSDDEKRALEQAEAETLRAEKDAERDELIATLQREKAIANAERSYTAMGWTSDEAKRMATADADNDFDARMKIMAEVSERQRKEYDVAALKNRPPIQSGVGGGTDTMTQEKFNKMGYREMLAFKQSDPDAYEKFSTNK